MNLLNFTTVFSDESSCKARWKSYRDKQGVICPHCGCKEHYWKNDKESYECNLNWRKSVSNYADKR